MKITVKILAALLCVCLILPLAVSCKKNESEDSSTQNSDTDISGNGTNPGIGEDGAKVDENGYLLDGLDPNLNFENYEFNILGWNSGYQSDFYAEMDVGDTVTDSVYFRNKKVEERLKIKLKANLIDGDNSAQVPFVEHAIASIMSGDNSEFDMIGCYSMCAGTLTTSGALTALNELDHLDFSKPWWSSTLIEMSKIKGNTYFITGDASNTFIYNLLFLAINKNMMRDLKLEDPRQLVLDNKWTLDKMIEMTKNVYTDQDDIAGPSVGDRFGLNITGQVYMDCFLASAGIRMAAENEKGIIQLTDEFLGEKTHNLIVKVNSWLWNSGDGFYNPEDGDKNQRDGNSLFSSVGGSTIATFTENAWEHGILPFPKYDADQENYYTNLGFAYTDFCIPLTARDANMSAAVLECMGSESYRSSAPTLFEKCLKSRWATDDLDAPMYNIIKSSIYVDANRIFSSSFSWFESAVALFRYRLTENKTDWDSVISAQKDTINSILAGISSSIEE